MKNLKFTLLLPIVASCCTPLGVTSSYGPVATSETHIKTTQPASFNLPALPPPSVYQAPPVQYAPPVLQSAPCQTYQAPVQTYNPCANYQAPVQYQATDPCQQYNAVQLRASPGQTPQYFIIQPMPQNPPPVQLQVQANKPVASSECP